MAASAVSTCSECLQFSHSLISQSALGLTIVKKPHNVHAYLACFMWTKNRKIVQVPNLSHN